MNKPSEDLTSFRASIDAIDDEIIALLKQRLEIVKQVGKHKSQNSVSASFIRAGREATMLRDLTKKMHGIFPPAAVATIWRMIISTSLNAEQNMTIAAYANDTDATCYWQAREYYGTFLDISCTDSADDIIHDVAENKVSVGILPLIDHSATPWWIRPQEEKNDLFVFARIPFVEEKSAMAKPVLAIANVNPEPTDEDISLCAVHTSHTKQNIVTTFKNAGLGTHFLAQAGGDYLVEIDRFVAAGSPVLDEIKTALGGNAFIRLLGAYAVPITL